MPFKQTIAVFIKEEDKQKFVFRDTFNRAISSRICRKGSEHMKRCLIVVDYQNDFVSGSLGFEGAELLDASIAEKIRKYRANGDTVVFTFDTHGEDYLKTQEGQNLPVRHCIEGTDGHRLYGETAKLMLPTDPCYDKHTFGSDALYAYLKETPFEHIELVGLVSNICVITNAILAKTAQPETPIIVDEDCTASHDPKLHEAAIAVMKGLQIRIVKKIHDTGPFYHGTKAELAIGNLLTPGHNANYGENCKANFIYLTATLDAAIWGAELASGEGAGRIYIVEPTGTIADDPNLTDKKFPGNPTRSYRTRAPLRIVGEVTEWKGHSAKKLAAMRKSLESLR
jgi:nicotinamidase-related amidase